MDKEVKKVVWQGSTQLAPVPAVLIGCGGSCGYKNNLITVAWAGIINSDKPMMSISIRRERYSYNIIKETKEFSCNLPTAAMAAKVDYCGVVSGRKVDKFKETGLTALAGNSIKSPIVEECPLSLECQVFDVIPLGSHDLFLAEITAIQVSEDFISENNKLDLDKENLLAYCHGSYYNLGEKIGSFGFSVKKSHK
ncbi:MAG: flavin reductase family protein [Lentisphaeria bacterium]|nr:flavin reductase family protein [Lentisphaeria bacterium]